VSLILQIETATTACSVALARDGKTFASCETDGAYTHAENLHVFIQRVLKQATVKPRDLSAVAVSRGPGSYTGLRIGASAAKGLSFALDIPLISTDTLQVMSAMAVERSGAAVSADTRLFPMIDARRMEVYTAVYDTGLQMLSPPEALVVDAQTADRFGHPGGSLIFGNGMEKCRPVLSLIPGTSFLDQVVPSATYMSNIAYCRYVEKRFEHVASFEPYYLKEFMFKTRQSG
jgi:tRNA threonylcarbamoyladenosine biosynthesis protein TsaB